MVRSVSMLVSVYFFFFAFFILSFFFFLSFIISIFFLLSFFLSLLYVAYTFKPCTQKRKEKNREEKNNKNAQGRGENATAVPPLGRKLVSLKYNGSQS